MAHKLNEIKNPADLKKVPINELSAIAEEIRKLIVETTAANGGHIAPSLGTVELTIALHYVLNAPKDKILWDVGHQAYAHKILTGRGEFFKTLRQLGGISGFPNKNESEYDTFTVGHSSTSVSQGAGLAAARDLRGEKHKIVSVIGDAAFGGGMALEAVNNVGQMSKDFMIVLNDNEHSISKTVGAISAYLNRILTNPMYNKIREDLQGLVKKIPVFGFKTLRAAKKFEEGLKNLLVPGILFEELGFRYFGPIDGHNISQLIKTLENTAKLNEPRIVHVITKKGKGYSFAEERPSYFHGTSPFIIETGKPAKPKNNHTERSYSEICGEKLVDMAKKNANIVGITAAMPDGTGMTKFAKQFPDRFFDAGIAEEHAVCFSGALARGGMRPIVCIYSSFLQRAYDQLIHDVALQDAPVIFCIDRAGIVGEDGPTHHGIFDIAFLRHIPNMMVMAPRDGLELEQMMEFALTINGPVAIRYPRGSAESHIAASTFKPLALGKSELLREGKDVALIAVGSMVSSSVKIADILSEQGIEASVINARFIKPLDGEMLENITAKHKKIVTLEEGVSQGGFGSAVLEFFEKEKINKIEVFRVAVPDHFIEHGKREELLKKYHLTPEEISQTIKNEVLKK